MHGLSGDGVAVLGVDLRSTYAGSRRATTDATTSFSEVEDLSKRYQRDLAFPVYRTPILAGIGAGGALTYAALAQTPAATVAGAVSVDPTSTLGTRARSVRGRRRPRQNTAASRTAWRRACRVGGWCRSATPCPPPCSRSPHPAPPTAAPPSACSPPPAPGLATTAAAPAGLVDLPLVEVPAAKPGDLMAVIYSGDGGWRDIDKQLGEALAAAGVPVVGVDSLRYFWRERTPDEIGRDLAQIIDVYTARWKTPRVALVGYSFGADILPFAYNRLPAAARDRIALVSLLGVEPRAAFEFSVTGWFGGEPPADAPAVLTGSPAHPARQGAVLLRRRGGGHPLPRPGARRRRDHQDHRRPPLRRRLRRASKSHAEANRREHRRRVIPPCSLGDYFATTPRRPLETRLATLASTRGNARPPV
jgi:alpha-beta hydrolase superfamily lysophospholipase